jgi:hypothetical protein
MSPFLVSQVARYTLRVFLSIQLLLFFFLGDMDDHRALVVLAEALLVTRDVNDSAFFVEEDWPDMEKSF